MGWWALGDDEIMGDGPADISSEAFARIQKMRADAGKPPLHFEDVAMLLAAACSRSGREVQPRPETKFIGLTATFDDGVPELRIGVDETKTAAPEEVTVFRDWAKKVAGEYKELHSQIGRKRPTMRELLEAAAFVLRPLPNPYLAEDEKRKLVQFTARYEHSQGQLSAEDEVAIVAAALRRNERRLGLLVEGGASMYPDGVVGTTEDGREVKADTETAQGSRELVDEMCDRFDQVIRVFRDEQPDVYVKSLSPQDRERYQRNVDGKGLPTLTHLIERTRARLADAPERWAPLKGLKVITSERSPVGLPAKPPPVKFVDSRLRVRHAKFGEGYVERTFEDGDKKYEVLFDNAKRVTLMARFLEEIEPSDAPARPFMASAPQRVAKVKEVEPAPSTAMPVATKVEPDDESQPAPAPEAEANSGSIDAMAPTDPSPQVTESSGSDSNSDSANSDEKEDPPA